MVHFCLQKKSAKRAAYSTQTDMLRLFLVIVLICSLTSANVIDPHDFSDELMDGNRELIDEDQGRELGFKSKYPSVPELDLDAYAGTWYQTHASLLPNQTYEKGLTCIAANYEIGSTSLLNIFKEVPTISITNAGRKGGPNGDLVVGKGVAWQFFPKYPASFVLTMEPRKKGGIIPLGGYKVILLPEVDESTGRYEWAVVRGGTGSIFVLVRDVQYFKENLQDFLLSTLDDMGFNKANNKPLETYQGEDCVYPDFDNLDEENVDDSSYSLRGADAE